MQLDSESPLSNQLALTVVSHNIRFATKTPSTGERLWSDRAQMLINNLHVNTVGRSRSLLCLQEVLHSQLVDIEVGLRERDKSDDWTYVGIGRDDGRAAGEYCPIFYRSAELRLLHMETKWLSPTPDRPSKYPGAGSKRLMTCAVFDPEPDSERRLIVINTHLDDQSSEARVAGARDILVKMSELVSRFGKSSLVILAGDFNSDPGDKAYQIVVDKTSPFKDCFFLCPPSQRYGFSNTFTGFGREPKSQTRIDFVFLSVMPEGPKLVRLTHAILSNEFADALLISDHRAVFANLLMDFA